MGKNGKQSTGHRRRKSGYHEKADRHLACVPRTGAEFGLGTKGQQRKIGTKGRMTTKALYGKLKPLQSTL